MLIFAWILREEQAPPLRCDNIMRCRDRRPTFAFGKLAKFALRTLSTCPFGHKCYFMTARTTTTSLALRSKFAKQTLWSPLQCAALFIRRDRRPRLSVFSTKQHLPNKTRERQGTPTPKNKIISTAIYNTTQKISTRSYDHVDICILYSAQKD